MKQIPSRKLAVAAVIAVALAVATAAVAAKPDPSRRAKQTLEQFKKVDPGLSEVLGDAAGYAILPRVTKGAFIIGGAAGQNGVLFEKGIATGTFEMTQLTVGAQAGGQEYSELIVFEDEATIEDFKQGRVKLAAQASAVAADTSASRNARYERGVQVYTLAKSGLMFEASVGGQTFTFTPFGSDDVASR